MRPCKFPDCPNDSRAYGYCQGHLMQLKQKRMLAPLKYRRRKAYICEVKGCNDKIYAKGLCEHHYNWEWLSKKRGYKTPDKKYISNKNKQCRICKKKAKVRGYCQLHYNRLKKYGNPEHDYYEVMEKKHKNILTQLNKLLSRGYSLYKASLEIEKNMGVSYRIVYRLIKGK